MNKVFILNLMKLKYVRSNAMIIGPKDTLYEGGYLFFNIKVKNYPYSPPDVSYVSRGNVRILS